MSIIYLPRSMSQSMITKRIIGKRLHQLGLTAEKVNGDLGFDEYLVMLPGNEKYSSTALYIRINEDGTVSSHAVMYGRAVCQANSLWSVFCFITMIAKAIQQ